MSFLENVPGVAARALTAVSTFIASRLVQLGLLEDESLDVVAFDGNADMTVSVHTALAAGYRPHNIRVTPERWWGCVGCRMLSFLVQKAHCWNVMNNVPMTAQNYLRAFLAISWVFAGPFLIHWWALVADLGVIAPFVVMEQISRRRAQ